MLTGIAELRSNANYFFKTMVYMRVNVFKLLFGCILVEFKQTIKMAKWQLKTFSFIFVLVHKASQQQVMVYLTTYHSLHDFANPLGNRLISVLVHTSHINCHLLLLILLCLAVSFLQPLAKC